MRTNMRTNAARKAIIVCVTLLTLLGLSRAASAQAVPVPTNVFVAAGNAQLTITWTGGRGASSYNLYRATAPGAETLLHSGIPAPTGSAQASYVDAGLINGTTYYYQVTAVAASKAETGRSLETRGVPFLQKPGSPGNFTAQGGNGSATLTWTASQAGATSYRIYRATTSGAETLFKANVPLPSGTMATYVDTGLTNGTTYYYEVAAYNGTLESDRTPEADATPLALPAAPASLSAVASEQQVSLTWPAVTGASSYQVRRASASGGPYATIFSATTTGYTDVGLPDGTPVYYVVAAVDSAGVGPLSPQATATPTLPVPAAPTGVTATQQGSVNVITWNAVPYAATYDLYRGTSAGAETLFLSNLTGNSDTDNALTNGSTYYYEVSAVNAAGQSAKSSEVHAASGPALFLALILLDPTIPGGTTGKGRVILSQTAPTGGAVVSLSAGDAGGNLISFLSVPATITIPAGQQVATFTFTTTAVPADATATLTGVYANPARTTILVQAPSLSLVGLNPATTAGDHGTNGYVMLNAQAPAGGGGVTVALTSDNPAVTVPATVVVPAASNGSVPTKMGYFQVFTSDVAVPTTVNVTATLNGVTQGVVLTLNPPPLPSTPTQLTLSATGTTNVSLGWQTSSEATSYNVKRSTTAGGPYTVIGTSTGIGTTSGNPPVYAPPYVDTTTGSGTTYYYVVSGVNVVGESVTNSNEASITPVAQPTGFSATAQIEQVALSWSPIAGATGYRLYRAPNAQNANPGTGQEALNVDGLTGTSYTDTKVTPGTTYYYEVTARNQGATVSAGTAESARSAEVNAVPLPPPAISSLSPSSSGVGAYGQVLTVNGSGFASGATVGFGGTQVGATYVSSSQLTVTVPNSVIAAAGTSSVTVTDPLPGANASNVSNAATFTVRSPVITSLSPTAATHGGPAFTLTVNGSSFVNGSTVQFNGTNYGTTFVSSTQLTAAIPASAITTHGTVNVAVVNPGSSGTTSNTQTFSVN